jgi:hypothetical protein
MPAMFAAGDISSLSRRHLVTAPAALPGDFPGNLYRLARLTCCAIISMALFEPELTTVA